MLIETFKKDIKESDQGNCQRCVIACAINRVLPEGYFASVSNDEYDICRRYGENEWEYNTVVTDVKLPLQVQRYIKRFDQKRTSIKPTVFNIQVPKVAELP